MFPLSGSRKLSGFAIGIAACVIVTGIAMFAIPMLHIGEAFFGQVYATIATLTGSHQAAQATADRSPNYSNWYPGSPGSPAVATSPLPVPAAPPNANPGKLSAVIDRLTPVAIYGCTVAVIALIWLV